MAATGGSLLDRVRRILRVPINDEPRSPSWAATLALTIVFTAGAGAVQNLPWTASRSDSRVVAQGRVGHDYQLRADRLQPPQPPEHSRSA